MEQDFVGNGFILIMWTLFISGGLLASGFLIYLAKKLVEACRRDSWLA